MKKRQLVFPVILMFIILAVLLVFMVLPIGKQTVLAIDGVTDLLFR